MAARKPNLLWAERSDKLFLTIDVQDAGASKPLVKVEEATSGNGRVIFKGAGKSHATGTETHQYELDLELAGKVDPEASKVSVTARHVVLVIAKASGSDGYWNKLTPSKGYNVKVDWDKWVDEDEEAEEALDPSSQFDLSSLSDFSNFQAGGEPPLGVGGLGGGLDGGEDGSDDEEMPELEKA